MMAQTYEKLINESIKGLPLNVLAEIADFIYFLRKRAYKPEVFEEELRSGLLNTELSELTRDEELHLEKEFEDYDKLYPRR
jgi:hypothetical protein